MTVSEGAEGYNSSLESFDSVGVGKYSESDISKTIVCSIFISIARCNNY